MDTAQWPQEIVVKPIEEIVTKQPGSALERKARPQKEQALNCPRCNSTNTKFCYYNNYSLTQPRYFCKTCRRYWTEGGSLRNIPVGGGSRKNKRLSSSSSSSSNNNNNNNSSKKLPDLIVTPNKIHHEGQDLNLAFPSSFSELIQVPSSGIGSTNNDNSTTTSATTTATATTTSQQLSALELLTGISSRGLNSFMPMPLLHQDPNFPLHHQDFKPSLNFSLDGIGNGYATLQETATGRLLFPFEDLKQVSTTTTSTDIDQQNDNREHGDSISAGYWTGMLGGSGGGGSW